ncbi:MAG: apolipoprotein N-acyltransferase [Akkermansiaceae bacterium]|nr:apolipoprotein N-acyltransferase [Verrucomicrobiales bacterium]
MKKPSLKAFLRSRYPLAIFAGFLLACAFPKIGIAGFGWIAPGLMLATALGTSGKQSFRLGYVAGLAHFLTSLYWLLCIPVRGFPILGWIALSAFLALYPAIWVWLAVKVSGVSFPLPGKAGRLKPLGLASVLGSQSWSQRTLWALACAALWVAWEMIIARFLGGFPWNLLGASQYRIVPLIQIAAVTGVYGVSFLLVWTSVSLLNAIAALVQRPQMRSVWVKEMALPMLTVAVSFALGFHQLQPTAPSARELKIALVQPSIPQTMIWDESGEMERFAKLMSLSQAALTNQPDLLIWPEAAIPKMLRYNAAVQEPILHLARSNKVWMIVGSDDGEPRNNPDNPDDADYYNSSFLISPAGEIVSGYRKRNLVIFGEYIPLVRWLPFIAKFTPVTGSFTPGDKAVPFVLDRRSPDQPGPAEVANHADSENGAPPATARVKTSVLICYEDNFPHLVREYVEEDTDFLVNITNNGWFGESAAQWQHAANAILRAIENGLPLVRCSNNGLTCWVDAQGRIREVFRDSAGTIYGAGFMTAQVPLLEPGEKRPPTFYRRHGDWFGWSCLGFAVLAVWRSRKAARLQRLAKPLKDP